MRQRLAAALSATDAAAVQRVDAVDGASLSDAQLRQCLSRRAYHLLAVRGGQLPRASCMDLGSKGAVGCYLSHLHVWRLMAQRGLAHALVLEDDAHFAPGFTSDVQTLINQMVVTDAAWGVLNIGFWEGFHPGELVHADLYESRNLDCGTHCYLISAAAAAHLAAAALPIDVQLDSALFMWLQHHGWESTHPPPRRFRPARSLAWQESAADSDIQTDCLHAVAEEWPEQHLRRGFA